MAAVRTNRSLDALFASSIGSAAHPRGRVLTVYRNTRRALQAVLAAGTGITTVAQVAEVMQSWRQDLKREAMEVMLGAVDIGMAQARADVVTYSIGSIGPSPDVQPVMTAMEATIDRQYAQVMAQAALGADAGVLLGDGARLGLLSPAPVTLDLGRLMVGLTVASWLGGIRQAGQGKDSRYRKQVVATIDDKTTECCLLAHGQVQPMDADFQLEGTPQYASELPWTPFHWNCRSSVALVLAETVDDDLSQQMRGAAQVELDARGPEDNRVGIWPSHARSGRA